MRLAASQPPEARGLGRDGVRLLVATPDGMVRARFGDLPRFLSAGDLLAVNTSATIAAAVDGRRGDGRPVVVHFSSPLDEQTPWAGSLDGRSPGEGTRGKGTPSGGPTGEGAPGETGAALDLGEYQSPAESGSCSFEVPQGKRQQSILLLLSGGI